MTTISQESGTRTADHKTALAGNPSLVTAINWLRQHTAASRLTELEVSEMIRDGVNVGLLTAKWNGTTIP